MSNLKQTKQKTYWMKIQKSNRNKPQVIKM